MYSLQKSLLVQRFEFLLEHADLLSSNNVCKQLYRFTGKRNKIFVGVFESGYVIPKSNKQIEALINHFNTFQRIK